jgi:hypothetical protein
MKKIILIPIFLSLLCSFISAGNIFTENFNYLDSFENHNGWNYASSGCDIFYDYTIVNPYYDIYGGNKRGFALNSTVLCGTQRYINANFSGNVIVNSGELEIKNNFFLGYDGAKANEPLIIGLSREMGYLDLIQFKFLNFTTQCINNQGCTICNMTAALYGVNLSNGQSDIQIDFSTLNYIWTITDKDGNLYSCNGIVGNNSIYFGGIRLLQQMTFGEYLEAGFTSLDIDTTFDNATLFGVDKPCTSDSECISGKCIMGYCAAKMGGEACLNDYECLSGFCTNGVCERASLWQNIDSAKDSVAGDDTNTNNLVSLIIIVILTIIPIVYGRNVLSVVVGMGVFFCLTLFFTIVGWLSPFILVGCIITLLVGIVLIFMLGGSSN